jgi:hypothetical protein
MIVTLAGEAESVALAVPETDQLVEARVELAQAWDVVQAMAPEVSERPWECSCSRECK